jgi:hypothetical protein
VSNEVGSVALGLELSTASFTKQLNSIAKKAAGTLAKAFSVKKLVDFGKQCIELDSDLAEVQNVVNTVFQGMTTQVDEFAQSAAANYGLSETMAKQFTGTFGSMAEAFGFTEKEAYNMSTTLTGLAGDVASFYNISQNEAYTKLKSVFSGETETLKDLGIVMTQSALDAYALANGYNKTTSAMTEMEKVSLRYAFIQDQLTNATGDFLKTQDSWANQSRLLALQAQSAMAAIGQGLINILRPALVAINTVMAKVVQLAEAFNSLTEALFGSAGSAAATASNLSSADSSAASLSSNLSDAVGELTGLSGSTGSAASGLGKASKAAQALKRQLEGFDQITKVSDDTASSTGNNSGGAGDSGGAGNTAGSAGTGIDTSAIDGISDSTAEAEKSVSKLSQAMQTLLTPATKAWDNLKKSFSAFASVVKSGGAWVLDNVLIPLGKWTISEAVPAVLNLLAAGFDVLTSVCEALEEPAQWIWENFLEPIAEWTGGVIVSVLEGLTDALTGLSDWIDEHQTAFSNIVLAIGAFAAAWGVASTVIGVISAITTAFSAASSVGALLQGVFLSIAPAVSPIVVAIAAAVAVGVLLYKNWDTICEWAGKLKDTVVTKITALKDGAVQKFHDLKSEAVKKFESLKSSVVEKVTGLKTKAAELVEKLKSDFINKFESLKTSATEKITGLKTAAVQKFNDLKSSIVTKVSDIKDSVVQKFTSIKDSITSKIEDAKDKVKSAIDKIKGFMNFSWSLPKLKLPHLSVSGQLDLFKIPPSLPKVSVSWYKKAMNNPMLLDKPTIFGAAGNSLLGAGEAGPEVVAGAEKLKNMIAGAVQNAVTSSQATVDLGDYVQRNTPRLAAVSSSEPEAEAQRLRQMVNQAQSTQDLSKLEALLEEILVLLKKMDIVSIDPEALRKYFIRKTNANTQASGGRCELKV